jgi:uncharacterized membrane protein YoaK (UPF0700 family)
MDLRYERALHRAAAIIGGFTGIYTILIRTNLGSSQTLNLLELLNSLLGRNFLEALAHFGGMIAYGGAIFLTTVLSRKSKLDMKLFSMTVNIIGFIVLGFLPENLNRCVGLYPTFIMMSIQWLVFGNLGGYASSPIFSTNNLRQMTSALAEYACDHKPEHLDKAKFFGGTLIFFHLGALLGYLFCKEFAIKASFFGVIPCVILCAMVLVQKSSHTVSEMIFDMAAKSNR